MEKFIAHSKTDISSHLMAMSAGQKLLPIILIIWYF